MRLAPFILVLFCLPAAASVEIVNAAARGTEDGPPPASDSSFNPGEVVYYSFQVGGVGALPLKRVRLSYHIEALDPAGVNIVVPVDNTFDAAVSEFDRTWKPKIRESILLPGVLRSGDFKIRARVTDDISHQSAQSEITFHVSGHNVESAESLTVRNFGFYRSEEETRPLLTPVFRAGDRLFARFDIVGFRYGERNLVNVSYDVAVMNPAGKQIYAQPAAAEDRTESYYPKHYVAGEMNLSLEASMNPGDYTIVLTIHDRAGRQDVESRNTFQVQ